MTNDDETQGRGRGGKRVISERAEGGGLEIVIGEK
jgi:hypothetical protein